MNTKKLADRKRLEPERPHSSSGNLTSLRDLASHGNLTSQGSRRLPLADHPVGFRTGFELDAHISGKQNEEIPTRLRHTPGDLSMAAAAPAAAVAAIPRSDSRVKSGKNRREWRSAPRAASCSNVTTPLTPATPFNSANSLQRIGYGNMQFNPKNFGHFVCGTLSIFSRLSLVTEKQPTQKSAVTDPFLCSASRVFAAVSIASGQHCRRPHATASWLIQGVRNPFPLMTSGNEKRF